MCLIGVITKLSLFSSGTSSQCIIRVGHLPQLKPGSSKSGAVFAWPAFVIWPAWTREGESVWLYCISCAASYLGRLSGYQASWQHKVETKQKVLYSGCLRMLQSAYDVVIMSKLRSQAGVVCLRCALELGCGLLATRPARLAAGTLNPWLVVVAQDHQCRPLSAETLWGLVGCKKVFPHGAWCMFFGGARLYLGLRPAGLTSCASVRVLCMQLAVGMGVCPWSCSACCDDYFMCVPACAHVLVRHTCWDCQRVTTAMC